MTGDVLVFFSANKAKFSGFCFITKMTLNLVSLIFILAAKYRTKKTNWISFCKTSKYHGKRFEFENISSTLSL